MPPILELESLRRAVDEGKTFRFVHFWKATPSADGKPTAAVCSQWWRGTFTVDGRAYASAEQWMMAGKARLFGDEATLAEILATEDPARIKALGKQVTPFDEKRWVAHRFDLVTAGNVAKFGQDAALKEWLLATGEDVLVEASPLDKIWGIGLAAEDPRAADPRTWRGLNLLGFALVRARAILRGELPPV